MGVQLNRIKKRNLLLTILYRLHKINPISAEKKLNLYLTLEWIFDRLAHETSFQYFREEEHPLRKYTKEYILNHIQKTDTVLDLGCKYGNLTNAIAEKAKTVVGVDFDQVAVDEANKRYRRNNLSFVKAEALEYIKQQNFSFDVLILSHILEHLDNPKEFINDFSKYFKLIYIELPDFDKTYLNHYRKELKSELIYTDTDHVTEFDRFELRDLISDCGLTIVESEYRFGIQKIWCKTNS